jgi:hypothetical protein
MQALRTRKSKTPKNYIKSVAKTRNHLWQIHQLFEKITISTLSNLCHPFDIQIKRLNANFGSNIEWTSGFKYVFNLFKFGLIHFSGSKTTTSMVKFLSFFIGTSLDS